MSSNHEKIQRIDIRTTAQVKRQLIKAAKLSGTSISHFLLTAACEKTERIMTAQEMLRLTNKERDCFLELLDKPPKPNLKLKKAMQTYQSRKQK